MSAIFGLVLLNHQTVDRAQLERMNAALATHGADGGGIWRQGHIGLGQRLMRFTPEDFFEGQPLISADGQRVLVSDGRVDNREELLADSHQPSAISHSPSVIPDSAFILRAYEKWGEDCARHLIGSFTFALWDAREQHLLLARSAIGGPSLFYHSTLQTFAFSTMPKGLFALPFIPREFDEQYLADYLAWAPKESGAGFYRDIYRLLPGNLISVTREGLKVKQYWQPDLKREIRFPRDEEYVQAFDELFERVVRDQLRSATPVGVMMSGGFDSTSVAATAARLLKREEKHLVTFTEVPRAGFNGAIVKSRYADETPFVQAMARQYDNLDLNLIHTDGRVYLDDLDELFVAAEIPFRNASNRVWYEAILREAQQQGVRVLLSGGQGNLTISWGGDGLMPQLLRERRWGHALREARALARQKNARSTLRALIGRGIMPLLPALLWFAVERLRRRDDVTLKSNPPWRAYSAINPEFAVAQKVDERARAKGHDFRFRPTADTRAIRYKTIAGTSGAGDGLVAGYQAMFGMDERDPTRDVRVVEFCLALPEEQYQRDGQTRCLIRRAMANRLPPEIL
jgi:asparagine synthase (glutamine-hydrolysing)